MLKKAGLKKNEKPQHYLPITFEGMMESFGINLQRKYYYDEFYKAHSQIENMTKQKHFTHTDIVNLVQNTGEQMRQIVSISSADSSSLKNQHNQLFLSLMERLELLKKAEQHREMC